MTHALFGGMIGEKIGNLYLVGGLEHEFDFSIYWEQ